MATMMTKIDADLNAFRRAIEILKRDPMRDQQLRQMIKDRHFDDVATFAAYCCQCQALKLKPWEIAPCHVSEEDEPLPRSPALDWRHYREAHDIARRLLRAGLSKFEPDPIAALERIKGRKRVQG
jgi:hypothetical protein